MVRKHLSFVSKLVGLSAIGVLIPVFSTMAQTQWPSGYYSLRGNVYALNANNSTYCYVQSPTQMNLFGGFSKVREVGSDSFKAGSRDVGKCGWPNGFYRKKSKPEVYGLNDKQACYVNSPQMMDAYGGFKRVRVVEDSVDLFAQRKFVGDCLWPR